MRRKSTVLQLIIYLQSIYKNVDTNTDCYALYLDFSKAFYSVSHATLLAKLRLFGTGGSLLSLLSSYYADDLKLIHNNLLEMQNDILALSQRSQLNKLSFNAEKTRLISFDFRSKNYITDIPVLILDDHEIFQKSVVDLGLSFSSNLAWSKHISDRLKACYIRIISVRDVHRHIYIAKSRSNCIRPIFCQNYFTGHKFGPRTRKTYLN